MAYGVEQDRLRALLPEEFASLRPVLRVNAEIRGGQSAYLEFNTAVQSGGVRGWLNIGAWENVSFEKQGKATVFTTDALTIHFTPVGIEGGCPAEKDNAGCFFKNGDSWTLRPTEKNRCAQGVLRLRICLAQRHARREPRQNAARFSLRTVCLLSRTAVLRKQRCGHSLRSCAGKLRRAVRADRTIAFERNGLIRAAISFSLCPALCVTNHARRMGSA